MRAALARCALASAAAAALACAPREAAANGRMPGASQLLFSPTDPNLVILRVTFGILVSQDAGATWSWMCEAAVPNIPKEYDPMLGLTANGSLVATVLVSLDRTPDLGCTWTPLACPIPQLSFVDVAVRPNAPHSVIALGATPSTRFGTDAGITCPGTGIDAGADAGSVYANQVLESTDDGANWSLLGTSIDPRALVTTVDAAASDPDRLYVSAFRDDVNEEGGLTRFASIYVSLDRGQHWTERRVPLDPAERAVYIAAIDPTNADRLYVRTAGGPAYGSRLLVSDDAAASFQSVLTLNAAMLGFALSQDGLKVYAGSMKDGLYAASRASLTFAKTSSISVACLATHGDEVWACSNEQSGFLVGVSKDAWKAEGATFTPKLHLCAIQSAIACPASAPGAVCAGEPLVELPSRLSCPTDAGAGAGDAEAGAIDEDAAAGGPVIPIGQPEKPSCGCAIRWNAGIAGFGLTAAIGAATVLRRRRRKSNEEKRMTNSDF